MSSPLFTCILSEFMISARNRVARSMESRDLPVSVGPITTKTLSFFFCRLGSKRFIFRLKMNLFVFLFSLSVVIACSVLCCFIRLLTLFLCDLVGDYVKSLEHLHLIKKCSFSPLLCFIVVLFAGFGGCLLVLLVLYGKIDDWLPTTGSRNAKWWYSASHNVTAMVGAGVLGLPYAMAQLGWGPGVAILVLSWVITLYTLWQMVEMHEMVPGRRFDRYHELGQYAFGEKIGLYIVAPQQLVVEVTVCIVYMVTGGKSLKKFHDTVCSSCKDIKLTYFIMIFASVHFVLSHLPKFNSISGVSLAAAAMSLSFSTIAWVASIHKGVQADVQYEYKAMTASGKVLNSFSALGDVAFAFAGVHNFVLKIQAKITSTPEKPSKGLMWRGVVVAYIVVAFCYFPIAIIGYWMFGNSVEDDILISLEKPAWLIGMANIFVVIHVIGCYQIYAMPVFNKMETVLVTKLNFSTTRLLRFAVRNVYVGFTMFIAITFPFFGDLLAFFGGFALVPITYFANALAVIRRYNNMNLDGKLMKIELQKKVTGSRNAEWWYSAFRNVTAMVGAGVLGLPKKVTGSRNAKWWYSASHNVTAMVGAGVLGLPYAMAQLGW
ncbi:hypothetical protein QYF36_005030 [Acer negundo]|nr:hypothetical protein QYF36_005030 [Acer negundo]